MLVLSLTSTVGAVDTADPEVAVTVDIMMTAVDDGSLLDEALTHVVYTQSNFTFLDEGVLLFWRQWLVGEQWEWKEGAFYGLSVAGDTKVVGDSTGSSPLTFWAPIRRSSPFAVVGAFATHTRRTPTLPSPPPHNADGSTHTQSNLPNLNVCV